MPEIPRKTDKRRGRLAKSDAHNLWERLSKIAKPVLLFAQLPHVPFTNNRAEQDLRMAKVKQKVSGCFRTTVSCQYGDLLEWFLNVYWGFKPAVYAGGLLQTAINDNQNSARVPSVSFPGFQATA